MFFILLLSRFQKLSANKQFYLDTIKNNTLVVQKCMTRHAHTHTHTKHLQLWMLLNIVLQVRIHWVFKVPVSETPKSNADKRQKFTMVKIDLECSHTFQHAEITCNIWKPSCTLSISIPWKWWWQCALYFKKENSKLPTFYFNVIFVLIYYYFFLSNFTSYFNIWFMTFL